jgi:hypothetical protein
MSITETTDTELVVSGKKTIELRKWNTKFRSEFLIHSSKRISGGSSRSSHNILYIKIRDLV